MNEASRSEWTQPAGTGNRYRHEVIRLDCTALWPQGGAASIVSYLSLLSCFLDEVAKSVPGISGAGIGTDALRREISSAIISPLPPAFWTASSC